MTEPSDSPKDDAKDPKEQVAEEFTKFADEILDLWSSVRARGKEAQTYADFLEQSFDNLVKSASSKIKKARNLDEAKEYKVAATPPFLALQTALNREVTERKTTSGEDKTVRTWALTRKDVEAITMSIDQFESIAEDIFERDFVHRYAKAPPRLLIHKLAFLNDMLFPKRQLGPWIEIFNIRKWMDMCDENHTHHCDLSARSREIFRQQPRWLVDVRRNCLVHAQRDQRYLALSYVWGEGSPFRTLKSNLDRLMEDGGLNNSNLLEHTQPSEEKDENQGANIPATVQHAIELTRLLNERYLWVDVLCIVQDDEDDKQEHLANMGSIYANAYATIVVATGAASEGIHGLEDVKGSKELLRGIQDIFYRRPTTYEPRLSLHTAIKDHHQKLQKTIWNERAWTFQEQIFSRRLIIIDLTMVAWECHCAVWFESDGASAQEPCQNNTELVAEGFSFHMRPSFADYEEHAAQYNRRKFTYPEDAMDAFAGILNVLKSAFPGGFICSLPTMFFDTSLLWYNEKPLEQRLPRREGKGIIMPPSWAWASWGGSIKFPDYSTSDTGVRPLVRWKYSSPDEPGWKLINSLEKQKPSEHNIMGHDLTFSLPRDIPFPPADSDPAIITRSKHLLYCRPQRVYLDTADYFDDNGIPLMSKSGDCIGMLTSSAKLGANRGKRRCEVVAISETLVADLHAYNVLWIDWGTDEIAYRKGVGRILKSDWQAQRPEEIRLILG